MADHDCMIIETVPPVLKALGETGYLYKLNTSSSEPVKIYDVQRSEVPEYLVEVMNKCITTELPIQCIICHSSFPLTSRIYTIITDNYEDDSEDEHDDAEHTCLDAVFCPDCVVRLKSGNDITCPICRSDKDMRFALNPQFSRALDTVSVCLVGLLHVTSYICMVCSFLQAARL